MRTLALLAASVIGVLSGRPAAAAPYCVQASNGVPAQCLYHDVAACREEARRRAAVCTLNLSEVRPLSGQRLCAVWNGPVVQCLYADRRSCDGAVARGTGICIDAGDPNSRPDPDMLVR